MKKTPTKTKKTIVAVKKTAPVVATPAPVVHKPHAQLQGPSKTFQQNGHWIEKPNKTPVIICECGNRYLKTRAGQTKCLRCMSALTVR